MKLRALICLSLVQFFGACQTAPDPVQDHPLETDPQIITSICSRAGVDQIRSLLEKDPGLVRARGCLHRTPLFQAARHSDVDMVRMLVEKGADVDAVCDNQATALVAAAGNGKADMVRYLLEKGAKVDGANPRCTPLQEAAETGRFDVVDILLAAGATYDLKSAILLSNEDRVKAILGSAPKDHDWVSDIRQGSFFNLACHRGHPGIVALLFDKFPFPNEINPGPDYLLCPAGSPPLWFALAYPEVTRFLLEKGADPKFPGLVFQAVFEGKVESVRMLLARGADVNSRGRECPRIGLSDPPSGFTPLQHAAEGGQLEMVRLLIDSKAEINAPSPWGTALSLAEKRVPGPDPDYDEIKKLLKAAGGK